MRGSEARKSRIDILESIGQYVEMGWTLDEETQ